MKNINFKYITRFNFMALVATMALVSAFAISTFAQGTKDTELAAGVTLEQCRNGGTLATAVPCNDAGGSGGWTTGNTGMSNSHWAETQFVPYRMKFTDLTVGSSNTVIIGFDILKGSIHAIDYLGSYNYTETTADPCGVVPGCSGYAVSTAPVPAANVSFAQIPGVFTLWGGTIMGLPAYVPCPSADPEEQCISVEFTANQTNPVLAWGGHIAWSGNWGVGNSAGGISGSPYHMRLISLNGSGGNQDRSLSANAVIRTGSIKIIKSVTTQNSGTASTTPFQFTATSGFNPNNFSLVDDDDGDGIDNQLSEGITFFGAGNEITISEVSIPDGWTLASIDCTASGTGTSVHSYFPGQPSVTVTMGDGGSVVCTYNNTQLVPSAGGVTVSGRVVRANGDGIPRVQVVISDNQGYFRSAITNGLGYYQIDDVEAGNTYVLSASSKLYQFAPRLLTPLDEIVGFNITAIE